MPRYADMPNFSSLHALSVMELRAYPALVDNAAVGVHQPDFASGVHLLGQRGREQRETLAPLQQKVQVVMEIVVQPARRTCNADEFCEIMPSALLSHNLSRACSLVVSFIDLQQLNESYNKLEHDNPALKHLW